MSRFFIHRPIFAWVIAIFVMLAGAVAITQLPVSQYPSVAPPTVRVMATYPGASAAVIDETVISVIEREMNGADGLMYMEATSPAVGFAQLAITFEPGTDPDIAQVEVQNRLGRAEPRLPEVVRRTGIRVVKATTNFLMVVSFNTDGSLSRDDVADYVNRNVLTEIQRVEGVGDANLYASGRSMRIWVDPAKLEGYGLAPSDVNNAINAQSMQVSGGTLGDTPSVPGQSFSATVTIPSTQLTTEDEFRNIVIRSRADGATVRIKDVARVELGIENYNFSSRQNGKEAVAVAVQLNSTGNALATSAAIQEKMSELEQYFPDGMSWAVPYDTSPFVDISIKKVVQTLFEAIVLVFAVMFLFLQNWRYTVIPAIVVPISLLGSFAVLFAAGMSINILSMFAMVLVIGIVVDDAIVVVENVERLMSEEGLSPLDATIKGMSEISGAVVGMTTILVVVFIPLAFFSGATGNIYRQFSIVMASSIALSGFFALTLTPALCATLLKPVPKGSHEPGQQRRRTGLLAPLFNGFNRIFGRATRGYSRGMTRVMRRSWITVGIYAAIIAGAAWLFSSLPTAFLPVEDQGSVIINMQLPPGATKERTTDVVKQVEAYMMEQPEVRDIVSIIGFNFSGTGQNVALAFATLTDWSERTGAGQDAISFAGRATGALQAIRDAFVIVITPPSIPELGTGTGFAYRLQDRGGMGHEALLQARNQLLGAAAQSEVLVNVRPDGIEDASQWQIDIDRDAAAAQGVTIADISNTLGTALGSAYVADFPNRGFMQRITVQAEASHRMTPEDVMQLKVHNGAGELVPLSTVVSAQWVNGPMQLKRYNGYPSYSITGDAAPGYATGDAIAEMERISDQVLSSDFGYEWTGISLDEKKAGAQAFTLYAFSILAVFLCLAALYESWSIPLSVMLVVPLGALGALLGVWLRDIPNDVFFQIGLVTVIGLSAKNAILIVEFAKDLQDAGMSVVKAALTAAHLRFRPIIMTSLAFILGVVPLYTAGGASSASQREIGTGVFWGLIIGTPLAVLMVPVFYLIVRSIFRSRKTRQHDHELQHDEESGTEPPEFREVLIP